MKTFLIAFLTVVAVLAGSVVLAHQGMHHMMSSHMQMKPATEAGSNSSMMDRSMPGMEHHGMQGMGDAESTKAMTAACQKMMAS